MAAGNTGESALSWPVPDWNIVISIADSICFLTSLADDIRFDRYDSMYLRAVSLSSLEENETGLPRRRSHWIQGARLTYDNQIALSNTQGVGQRAVVSSHSPKEDLHDALRVLGGETSAFEGIVRRWQSPLINLAYRFCHDRARAEEMAQEVFLRAYRNLTSWRQESAFSTWLFALATNLYCSQIRRLPPLTLPFEDAPEPADTHRFDKVIEQRHEHAIVRRAVENLPAKYREVLTLYYFHEMDVPATAASLVLPEGTVKVRLFRARNLLRDKLKPILKYPVASLHQKRRRNESG